MLKQVKSDEVWGTTPRFGSVPAVQAYDGRLPAHETGIEFYTEVAPTAKNWMNGQVAWDQGFTGVEDRDFDQSQNRQYVGIKVMFYRIHQKRHPGGF